MTFTAGAGAHWAAGAALRKPELPGAVYTPVEGGIRVECPANGNNWKTAAAESPLPQDMKQLFGEK